LNKRKKRSMPLPRTKPTRLLRPSSRLREESVRKFHSHCR
jgi:hypothetical protein